MEVHTHTHTHSSRERRSLSQLTLASREMGGLTGKSTCVALRIVFCCRMLA